MLGIPTFEDKVAHRAVTMVLEAIYERRCRLLSLNDQTVTGVNRRGTNCMGSYDGRR
jgi:hypothetical protein